MTYDLLELAWAAGFFDGEGSTCLRTTRGIQKEIWVQVPQSEPTTLERFQCAVGGLGKIYGPYQPKRPGALPVYRLDFRTFADCQAVIALLWRFLSGPKREQARACLIVAAGHARARAAHGKGVAKLTRAEAAELRAAHAEALKGRQRVPQGFITGYAVYFGVSKACISQIISRMHYND